MVFARNALATKFSIIINAFAQRGLLESMEYVEPALQPISITSCFKAVRRLANHNNIRDLIMENVFALKDTF